jgi:hypothetical protein
LLLGSPRTQGVQRVSGDLSRVLRCEPGGCRMLWWSRSDVAAAEPACRVVTALARRHSGNEGYRDALEALGDRPGKSEG